MPTKRIAPAPARRATRASRGPPQRDSLNVRWLSFHEPFDVRRADEHCVHADALELANMLSCRGLELGNHELACRYLREELEEVLERIGMRAATVQEEHLGIDLLEHSLEAV